MKQSHYTTPRTMEEAEFQPWGEAFHYTTDHDTADSVVMWASIAALLALGTLALMGVLA